MTRSVIIYVIRSTEAAVVSMEGEIRIRPTHWDGGIFAVIGFADGIGPRLLEL